MQAFEVDRSLPEHGPWPDPVERSPRRAGERVTTLSRVLRGIGALVVAASAATFLFQRWEEGSDLTRYFALLAQAGVLSATGFFCAVQLAEAKGARTFQALAAGMVPALFAILGGLVYSQFSLDGPLTEVAAYATWRAPDAAAALLAVAATIVVAIPIAGLAFLSLARTEARILSGVFLALNGLVLLPTRDAGVMAGLVAASLAGLAALELKRFRANATMATREGWIVRAMLGLPMALLVARSVLHYELSLYMGSILCFGIGGLFFAFGRSQEKAAAAAPFELASLVPIAVGWMAFSVESRDAFGLAESAVLPMAALPFVMTGGLLSFAVRTETVALHRSLVLGVGLLAVGANLMLGAGGVWPAFAALVLGIAGIAFGFFFARRLVLVLGAGVAGLALLQHVAVAARLYDLTHWSSLSLLGIGIIVGASLLERHHVELTRRLEALRRRVQGGATA